MALTEVDDKALVQGHKSGDPGAFPEIVLAYRSSLYAHALRRLRDPAAAEDAVQETLLRALRALPRFNGEFKLGAWLHKILTNVCLDEATRRRRVAHIAERVAAQPMPPAPAADHDLVLDLPVAEMEAALEALPPTHREALVMRVVEDRPYSEVAEVTGITEDNARARVSRARSAMRSMLGSVVSGLAVLLPFLRRQPKVVTPSVDGVAASASSPLVGSGATQAAVQWAPLSNLASQATDVATNAGPAVAGKIAVTVAAVAAVAMPTGAAITQSQTKPPAPAAAEEATTPTARLDASATSESIESLVVSGGDLSAAAAEGEAGMLEETATTSLTSTTAAPAGGAAEGTGESTDGATGTTAPQPAPSRGSALSAAGLTITESGPRLEVSGRATFDDGTEAWAGHLAGKILVEEADPADPSAPREVDGTLTLTGDDGRRLEVRLGGTAVVSQHANGDRTYEFSGPFRLSGDDGGTDTEGGYEATLVRANKDDESSLSISFNGGPADDGTTSTTTAP